MAHYDNIHLLIHTLSLQPTVYIPYSTMLFFVIVCLIPGSVTCTLYQVHVLYNILYRYVLMHVLYMTVEYIRSMYSIHVPKTSVRPSYEKCKPSALILALRKRTRVNEHVTESMWKSKSLVQAAQLKDK